MVFLYQQRIDSIWDFPSMHLKLDQHTATWKYEEYTKYDFFQNITCRELSSGCRSRSFSCRHRACSPVPVCMILRTFNWLFSFLFHLFFLLVLPRCCGGLEGLEHPTSMPAYTWHNMCAGLLFVANNNALPKSANMRVVAIDKHPYESRRGSYRSSRGLS